MRQPTGSKHRVDSQVVNAGGVVVDDLVCSCYSNGSENCGDDSDNDFIQTSRILVYALAGFGMIIEVGRLLKLRDARRQVRRWVERAQRQRTQRQQVRRWVERTQRQQVRRWVERTQHQQVRRWVERTRRCVRVSRMIRFSRWP